MATTQIHAQTAAKAKKAAITHEGEVHLPAWAYFAIAGASGMSAWLFVHPVDVLKVRMQLMGRSAESPVTAIAAARAVVKSDGFPGFYKGLSAGMLRQAVYTTLRLGLFDEIKNFLHNRGREINVLDRGLMGLAAGGIASLLTCPVEVCLVRMQADGQLPLAERRGYKGITDALIRVAREEGLRTYWRGANPTVMRAMVVSATQLGTYDQVKTMLLPALGDSHENHLLSALTAAWVYSFASLPLDLAKTRMQTATAQGKAAGMSNSTFGTLAHVARTEGAISLWKGFLPYGARCSLHTVGMFMFKEYYAHAFEQVYHHRK